MRRLRLIQPSKCSNICNASVFPLDNGNTGVSTTMPIFNEAQPKFEEPLFESGQEHLFLVRASKGVLDIPRCRGHYKYLQTRCVIGRRRLDKVPSVNMTTNTAKYDPRVGL